MKRQFINEQWNDFCLKCMPLSAPALQKKEMRRAFYAGVEMILVRVLFKQISTNDEPTPEDEQLMKDIYQELVDFGKSVKEGKA